MRLAVLFEVEAETAPHLGIYCGNWLGCKCISSSVSKSSRSSGGRSVTKKTESIQYSHAATAFLMHLCVIAISKATLNCQKYVRLGVASPQPLSTVRRSASIALADKLCEEPGGSGSDTTSMMYPCAVLGASLFSWFSAQCSLQRSAAFVFLGKGDVRRGVIRKAERPARRMWSKTENLHQGYPVSCRRCSVLLVSQHAAKYLVEPLTSTQGPGRCPISPP